MNRALFAAASGMAGEEANLNVIADNLANAEVAGFKQSILRFRAMTDGRTGYGTQLAGKELVFRQGKLVKSGGPFDVAIDGPGFFILRRPDGTQTYTRNGAFSRAPDGTIRAASGAILEGVHVPVDALRLRVGTDGHVVADTPTAANVDAGHIKLAAFAGPEHLQATGDGEFLATRSSGRAFSFTPGNGHTGRTMFGMLEQSNVSVMEAMMEILSAQRAFEANSKGVEAADEMLQVANNLQRG